MNSITRNLAIADNPRDAFRGQSRSPNMVPFHMFRLVSYYCAIVIFVRKTHAVFLDIRLPKMS